MKKEDRFTRWGKICREWMKLGYAANFVICHAARCHSPSGLRQYTADKIQLAITRLEFGVAK